MAALSKLIGVPKGITSVIGSGGKTTLIRVLSGELSEHGSVLLLTTTKIFPPDFCPVLAGDITEDTVREALRKDRVVCAGVPVPVKTPEGIQTKLSAPRLSLGELKPLADYILIEADGSKHMPLKAHLEHEPVIPKETDLVIQVAGLHGIGKPVGESVHRPERFLELLGKEGADMETPVSPEDVAAVLAKEVRGDILFLNGKGTTEQQNYAERLAELVRGLHYRHVVSGNIWERSYTCWY